MRTSIRLAAVALVVAIGLTASGCATDDPAPKPSTSTSAAPLFASDEEALAAAEEAYAAYLAVSDTITADGGANVGRIDSVVSPSLQSAVHASLRKYEDRNLRTTGQSNFDTATLQRSETDSAGVARVGIYVCLDVTNVRVISADGSDATPVDRVNRLPLAIDFISTGQGSLVMDGSDSWTGENFC